MASSKTSIYAALAANLLIAITKFIAGGITNSGAMLAEGVHSVVDTVNELLLLLGLSQARKPADATHPFGYGKELYFWSFIVSILIFGLGGGISIYEGINHIQHPEALERPIINYIVLSLSIIFEGASLIIAAKHFNQSRGETPWWEAVVKSKDPSNFLVLFEDAAAVMGLFIVLICTVINHQYNLPFLDGVASILVGLVLVAVSAILARESRSLLMGEGIAPETKTRICQIVEADPAVAKTMHILSTYQAPEEILLMLIVAFKPDLDTKDMTTAIDRIRDTVKAEYRLVRYVIIQPETVDHQDTFME